MYMFLRMLFSLLIAAPCFGMENPLAGNSILYPHIPDERELEETRQIAEQLAEQGRKSDPKRQATASTASTTSKASSSTLAYPISWFDYIEGFHELPYAETIIDLEPLDWSDRGEQDLKAHFERLLELRIAIISAIQKPTHIMSQYERNI